MIGDERAVLIVAVVALVIGLILGVAVDRVLLHLDVSVAWRWM